ncbi:hypothetical protein NDU88_005420 [Pleurodeles waltl]|uniref:Uncharacterized protein n=1 Tax=Pleurodeles waltl TaxID=8319 RepID=A0AAV7LP49_PLEWA|nr:hypothetical protein NDU88_005420 [Pleurodeles waltl]
MPRALLGRDRCPRKLPRGQAARLHGAARPRVRAQVSSQQSTNPGHSVSSSQCGTSALRYSSPLLAPAGPYKGMYPATAFGRVALEWCGPTCAADRPPLVPGARARPHAAPRSPVCFGARSPAPSCVRRAVRVS